jgi:hypothetical protein
MRRRRGWESCGSNPSVREGIPRGAEQGLRVQGVLRLRMSLASRSSYCAQDDRSDLHSQSLKPYFVTGPQAMRSPEAPEGSVL